MSLLTVSGLGRAFGGVKAVDGVDFELARGEMLALIGPNGAGKSTTFNMINGQLAPSAGSIRLDGRELVGRSPRQISRMGVGRTFQIAATFRSMTVRENVQMALIAHHRRTFSIWPRAGAMYREQALALLAQVGMAAQSERACSTLAYGDVKRVELAMALANSPRLLLMDEPTAGMAPAERDALMRLTRDLARAHDIAVLFTEHSMDVVFAYADRVLALARGKLIAQGTPDQVRNDAGVQQVYFGTGRSFEQVRAEAEPSIVMASVEPGPPAAPTDASEPEALRPVLQVRALNAWYSDAHILFDVDLEVHRGEVVALMGRNGAGKSTTLKTLMGLVPRRTGDVAFLGESIQSWPPHRIARAGLGYVPEDRRVFTDLTVLENLDAGRQAPRSWPDGQSAPTWQIASLFELFPNLQERRHTDAGHLSGGEQQMLTVARTLAGQPLVVLLDEPSEGVAPIIVEQMGRAILALKAQGVSILLSEQNMHFVQWVADRVYVLEKGQIAYTGNVAALAADEQAQRKYLAV